MGFGEISVAEQIQSLAAKILATHPVGHQLYLIGGFRYRLLNASCRASADIDYHWEGNLDRKQAAVVEVLRRRFLPEVQRQFAYDGDIRASTGPEAEPPVVRTVDMAFYRAAEAGSRIEIPLEITRIPHLDPAAIRTVAGTVFLTVSDADMIESKIVALMNRTFTRARDLLDIFLFQDTLHPGASLRLTQKFDGLALAHSDIMERLHKLQSSRAVHVREIERLLQEQVDAAVGDNLRVAGGAEMIWETAMGLVTATLTMKESGP